MTPSLQRPTVPEPRRFPGRGPLSRDEPIPGCLALQRKENSSRGPRQLLRVRLRYRTRRVAAPISATPGSGIITRLPFDRPGMTEANVSLRRPSYSSRRIFVKYFFLPLTAGYGPDAPVPSIFRANWCDRWVVTHSLADSDFHQPMVTPPISTNTFPGVWWASALGALTRHLVHLAVPVLLIKSGPLGDSHSTPRLKASKPGFLTIYAPIPPAWRAPAFTFIVPWGLEDTFLLARALDSLVCVSRWAGWVADLATDLEHPLPGATSHLRPRPFLAKPEPAAAHRLGRSASDGGQTTCQTAVANQGNPHAQTGTTRPAELNPLGSTIESTI